MDKNRFETMKEIAFLDPKAHPIQALFSIEDLRWLFTQVEELERLVKKERNMINWLVNEKMIYLEGELRECKVKLDRMEKKTIAKILAHIEANFTEVEQVEEYLWQLLDKGTEFE